MTAYARFRSCLLFSTALTLATSALASEPAPQNAELKFYPVKGWTVGAYQGGPACAMQNEFNNGFVLQFDGTADAPPALRVNFRQNVFTAGQIYNATVAVPGQMPARQLRVSASSATTVDLPLTDTALMESLRRAPVLDVDIDGNPFRFYLTGFLQAADRYTGCVQQNAPQMVETQPAPMPKQAPEQAPTAKLPPVALAESPVPDDNTLQRSFIDLNRAPPPQTPIAAPDNSAPPAEALIEAQTMEQNEKSAKLDTSPRRRLSEELAAKMAANDKFTTAPVKMQDSAASAALRLPQPQTQDLPQEQPQGQEIVAVPPAEEPPAPAPVLAARPAAREAVPEPASEPMTPAPITKTPPMKVHRETARFEADFSELGQVEPAAAPPEADTRGQSEMARKIAELESTIGTLKQENASLDQELKQSLHESREERSSVANEDWNLERATMRYQESERQVKKLGQQLQQERARCGVEKKDLEGMLFDPQVTSQEQLAKLSSLEQQLAQAQQNLQEQRMRYEERIKILEQTR